MKIKRFLIIGLASTLLCGSLGWFLLPKTQADSFEFWMLNVGQGESVFLHEPTGKTLLFDGGPDESVLGELGSILPVWERTIDVIVLSHPHSDHIRGLISVINRYQVHEVWDSGSVAKTSDFKEWTTLLLDKHIPEKHIQSGMKIPWGSTNITAYYPIENMVGQSPDNAHDGDVVLKITYQQTSLLLIGDLNENHEEALLASCVLPLCNLQAAILQIPHHGSASGLTPSFLKAINPQVALIPVGLNNTFHHPRPEIIRRLGDAHIPIFRTDQDQRIHGKIHANMVTIDSQNGKNLLFSTAELSVPP